MAVDLAKVILLTIGAVIIISVLLLVLRDHIHFFNFFRRKMIAIPTLLFFLLIIWMNITPGTIQINHCGNKIFYYGPLGGGLECPGGPRVIKAKNRTTMTISKKIMYSTLYIISYMTYFSYIDFYK